MDIIDMRSGTKVKSRLISNGNDLDIVLKEKGTRINFVTGEYYSKGKKLDFDDLFTFTRAGKAWLVKDDGVFEYAVDEPRFDNGILLEQESTNHFPEDVIGGGNAAFNTLTYLTDTSSFASTVNRVVEVASAKEGSSPREYYQYRDLVHSWSVYVKAGDDDTVFGFAPNFKDNVQYVRFSRKDGVIEKPDDGSVVSMKLYGDWTYINVYNPNNTNRVFMVKAFTEGSMYVALRQIENGVPSSYIHSPTSFTTRPADFLQSKALGTTLTGDWDDTLELSLVDGKLMHNGYGRIRTLEIK